MIMVSVCLPFDALSQHLPSYLGFSYLGRGLSLHDCSSKAQLLLLTLDEEYLLTVAPPDLEHGVAPLGPLGIPDHLTHLLRNLYAGPEATARTGHGPTDWFQIRKGVCQGCILSPCLFNLYAEYIMRNTGLEEAQAEMKIARRNINNFRNSDDITLRAEREEELRAF